MGSILCLLLENYYAIKSGAEKREKDNENKRMANNFTVLPAYEPSNKKLLRMHQTPLLRKYLKYRGKNKNLCSKGNTKLKRRVNFGVIS